MALAIRLLIVAMSCLGMAYISAPKNALGSAFVKSLSFRFGVKCHPLNFLDSGYATQTYVCRLLCDESLHNEW